MPSVGTPIWWQQSGDERVAAIRATCDNLERIYAPRRRRALRNFEIYEGRRLGGLHPYAFFSDNELTSDRYDQQRLNLGRALVNTAQAKIAGKQRPKAQFCVTEGDWTTKRRAKKLERFVEAQMLARQGNLHDGWAVGQLALRDCEVTDWGVLKFWADRVRKRVMIDRVLPWELLVDPFEARYGQPRNFFHVYGWDKDDAAVRFPKFRDQIMAAPSLEEESIGFDASGQVYGLGPNVSRMIKVRECWRMRLSEDKPGVHSLVMGTVDVLDGEDYERDFPPFELMTWEPWMVGIHGSSLIDNVANICDEINSAMSRWSDAERLCSNGVITYEEGTVDEATLESNEIGVRIPVKAGAQMMPVYNAPSSVNETSIQWLQFCWGKGFEVPGISQQTATAQKEPGVDAAVAMRTIENVGSERLAIPWQMYERVMAIGAARQILACCRELSEDGQDVVVKWPGANFLQPINLADVDIEEDQYVISIQAVSGLINTPADRLELASELLDRQLISSDAYLRIIQFKDVESEIGGTTRQSALVEKYIEQWLDATPEKQKNGEFRYRPPIPFMALEDAILQVGRAYMEAELDDAPDFNLGFFLRFMDDCDAKIQKKAAQAAQLQAAAAGKGAPPAPAPDAGAAPPPAGPPPGMPNGAMMQ